MPGNVAKKDKKKHNRGKQFSNFEDVARREGTWKQHKKDRTGADSSSSEDEDEDEDKSPKKAGDEGEEESNEAKKPVQLSKTKKGDDESDDDNDADIQPLNRGMTDEARMLASGNLTRKHREELEKERKQKAYEKAHREGKTDEAKADLARLAEIRKKREPAKAAREEEQKAEDAKKAAKSANSNAAFVEALGGEKSRKMPGGKKERTKDECKDLFADYKTDQMKVEQVDTSNAVSGSIEACRAAEDDFM